MPSFSTKSTEQRLTDTAAYIEQRNPQAASKVYQWGINATTHEMRRIGEKMHMGKTGTADERRLRRAMIMMRAGVMRHDIRKVVIIFALPVRYDPFHRYHNKEQGDEKSDKS